MTNRNRLFNCTNPYQGKTKKVLCVCSAGLLRSPTTANVLHRDFGYNTRACGIDLGHALILLDEVLLAWADEIVCMDEYQKERIEKLQEDHIGQNPPVFSLSIPDSFTYMDEELQEIIHKSYAEVVLEEQEDV